MFTKIYILPTFIFLSLFLITAGLAHNTVAATKAQVRIMVIEEAQRNGTVPASLALAVAKVESGFDERAESSVGARGVMQIMPRTAKGEFDVSADRLWQPRLNIQLGISYLERLYHQYGKRWNLALSHYNGGTLKGKGKHARPHSYTRSYVSSVLAWSQRYERETTVAALESASIPSTNVEGNNYWMYDIPDVDRNWRHYLKVADHWMRSESEPTTENSSKAYWDEGYQSNWVPVEEEGLLPSESLRTKVIKLQNKFRRSLKRNEAPSTPMSNGRWPRFS